MKIEQWEETRVGSEEPCAWVTQTIIIGSWLHGCGHLLNFMKLVYTYYHDQRSTNIKIYDCGQISLRYSSKNFK